jgi:hypothetical protein
VDLYRGAMLCIFHLLGYLHMGLHGVTTPKYIIIILTGIRTSNLTNSLSLSDEIETLHSLKILIVLMKEIDFERI